MPVRVTTEPAQGWARCVTPGCPDHDVTVSIDLNREVSVHRAEDLPVDLLSHTYLHAADDADLACGSCGNPRHVTDQEPRVIPNHLGQLAGTPAAPLGVFEPGDEPVPVEDPAETMARAMLRLEQMRAAVDEAA